MPLYQCHYPNLRGNRQIWDVCPRHEAHQQSPKLALQPLLEDIVIVVAEGFPQYILSDEGFVRDGPSLSARHNPRASITEARIAQNRVLAEKLSDKGRYPASLNGFAFLRERIL